MKYRINKNVRIDGKNYMAGDIIEMSSVPAILSGDMDPIGGVPMVGIASAPVTIVEPVPRVFGCANSDPLYRIAVFVTGDCDMNCPYCSQAEFRSKFRHQEYAVVKHVLDTIKASGTRMVLSVTGGEPTLWPHLREMLEYAHDLGCFDDVWMYSNGTRAEISRDLIKDGLVTIFRTNAANCRTTCNEMQILYPDVVKISKSGHIPLPTKPLWNSIPAACNCPGIALQGEYIYPCPNFYSITTRHGWELSEYHGSVAHRYDTDWISAIQDTKTDRLNMRHCMYCEANKYYQDSYNSTRVKRYEQQT